MFYYNLHVSISSQTDSYRLVTKILLLKRLSDLLLFGTNGILILFKSTMTSILDEITIPFHSLLHSDKCCSNGDQVAIVSADSLSPSLHKPYWSNKLEQLKPGSIVDSGKHIAHPRLAQSLIVKRHALTSTNMH